MRNPAGPRLRSENPQKRDQARGSTRLGRRALFERERSRVVSEKGDRARCAAMDTIFRGCVRLETR